MPKPASPHLRPDWLPNVGRNWGHIYSNIPTTTTTTTNIVTPPEAFWRDKDTQQETLLVVIFIGVIAFSIVLISVITVACTMKVIMHKKKEQSDEHEISIINSTELSINNANTRRADPSQLVWRVGVSDQAYCDDPSLESAMNV